MEEKLMTSGEAAAYLGVSKQRIHELIAGGKLVGQRAGRFYLFTRAELDRWKNAPKSKGGRPKSNAPSLSRPAGAMRNERPGSRKPQIESTIAPSRPSFESLIVSSSS